MSGNLAASVRARLTNLARERKEDIGLMFTRYGLERLLYRLSRSRYNDRFLLKGALLFNLWYDVPHRPTRDVDLLGFGPNDIPELETVFRAIVSIENDDGLIFDPASVRASEIRKEAGYRGVRILLGARLAQARLSLQVDIGFGDAVIPAPEQVAYPALLDMPAPLLRAYRPETVIAEKLQAMVMLGETNSRMKDFFDLWVMAKHSVFELKLLADAIRATFARRETTVPEILPFLLTEQFAPETAVYRLWNAFIRKNGLEPIPIEEMQRVVSAFVFTPLAAAGGAPMSLHHWQPGELRWIRIG
ncbi:MAG: hypothetical protein A3I66_21870 [Burkholderiales bacterium RIFCSPLOWO2_02_FULL_57_36]|nr:MAG: hypothetical protein A3I66_21870 [Burkholderiales bacterium RIFCSPLOWO2_02_FULL_57_36]